MYLGSLLGKKISVVTGLVVQYLLLFALVRTDVKQLSGVWQNTNVCCGKTHLCFAKTHFCFAQHIICVFNLCRIHFRKDTKYLKKGDRHLQHRRFQNQFFSVRSVLPPHFFPSVF